MEKQNYLMLRYWGHMEATVGHKRAESPMETLSRHRRPTLPPHGYVATTNPSAIVNLMSATL
jgi:hypothetical protein